MHARPLLFRNARLAFPDFFTPGELLVENGLIAKIWINQRAANIPANVEIHDCADQILAPGLVDIHNNGAVGREFVAADPEGNNKALDYHARHGVTSVLATVMTASPEQMLQAVQTLVRQRAEGELHSSFAGIHIEGPYFAVEKRGAHRLECVRDPVPAEYIPLIDAGEDSIRLFTFAPERPGALDLCQFLHERGIVPTIGHTIARFDDIQRAAAAGARHFVHAHNAIDWPTRAPHADGWLTTELMGMGALIADSRFTAEIIADGHHVPPELIQALIRAKGADALALVSDAAPACGCPPGEYTLAGATTQLRDNRLVVATQASVQGVPPLGGSATPLLWMLQNCQRWGSSLLQALKMATAVPARIAQLPRKGQLLIGNDADLILLDDRAALHGVWLQGSEQRLVS